MATTRSRTTPRSSETVGARPGAAERTLADAQAAAIDLATVTVDLEVEGVGSFCDSYSELLECIQSKLGAVAG
jgi:hypothetical protein